MKSNDWYNGKAPLGEYKGVLDILVSYPMERDFVSYRIIMPDGSIDPSVTKAYVENMKFKVPTKMNPTTDTMSIEAGGRVIVQWNMDEVGYKQAMTAYQIQGRILGEIFRNDLREEYLPAHYEHLDAHIYAEAWERGHSAGYSEVASYYQDIVYFATSLIKTHEDFLSSKSMENI